MASILLVEDDPILAKSLSFNILSDGHKITCAATIREADHLISQSRFDLAVLDINLPDFLLT